MFSPASPRRRIICATILLILVSTIIPYQFAYMVGCVVQLATCVRAQWHARETVSRLSIKQADEWINESTDMSTQKSAANVNFANYTHSMFVLMLWVLPINVLVLLVWAHNLVVHWYMPFSSHHNILSVMPFILLVGTMTVGAMVPRITTRYVVIFGCVSPFAFHTI